jgi:hypothetical protein
MHNRDEVASSTVFKGSPRPLSRARFGFIPSGWGDTRLAVATL